MSDVAVGAGGTIGQGVGTWVGRVVGGAIGELFGPEAVPLGAYVGGRVGGWAGGATGSFIASHMSNANDRPDTKAQAGDQTQACSSCLKKPNRRHDPCKTRGNDPTKPNNTMIDPDHARAIANDVQSIQDGKVPMQSGTYTTNGRTYGVHNQALFPQSGTGFTNVNLGTHQLLKQLNSNGYEAAMNFAEKNPSISQQDIDEALGFEPNQHLESA